jgi:opacity protein-like surface antigen
MPTETPGARRPSSRAIRAVAASVLATIALAAPPVAESQDCSRRSDCGRAVPPWERRQDVYFSAFASGLYSGLEQSASGRDGFGFDGGVALGIGAFSLGTGYQRTFHGRSGARATAVYEGVFVEPRVSLLLGYGAFTPYVAGRLVRVGRLFDRNDSDDTRSPDGVQFGGGAGLLVDVSPRLSVDLGAMYTGLRLDDGDAGDRRTTNGVLLRVGLTARTGRRLRD